SGWSLQSAVTGTRASLPQTGAEMFVAGSVNHGVPIYLDPGTSAFIVSGISPVGISLRENVCTGYLAQLQHFSPGLDTACPDPSDMLPMTADNLRIYGASCVDYVQSLPR